MGDLARLLFPCWVSMYWGLGYLSKTSGLGDEKPSFNLLGFGGALAYNGWLNWLRSIWLGLLKSVVLLDE